MGAFEDFTLGIEFELRIRVTMLTNDGLIS